MVKIQIGSSIWIWGCIKYPWEEIITAMTGAKIVCWWLKGLFLNSEGNMDTEYKIYKIFGGVLSRRVIRHHKKINDFISKNTPLLSDSILSIDQIFHLHLFVPTFRLYNIIFENYLSLYVSPYIIRLTLPVEIILCLFYCCSIDHSL